MTPRIMATIPLYPGHNSELRSQMDFRLARKYLR